MSAALVVLAGGVLVLCLGSLLVNVKVRRRWGAMNRTTMGLSEGNGVVPSWISLMILTGWVAVAVGAVWFVVDLL